MRRFALLVVAAMLPAVILAMIPLGYDYYQRERARLIRDSLSTTRALAAAVDTEFAVVKASLQALSTSRLISSADLAEFHARALDAVRAQDSFVNVVLSDESGSHLLNTFRPYGERLDSGAVDKRALANVFRNDVPFVSGLFMGKIAQRHLIGVAVPVKRDGRVHYALGAAVSNRRLSALLGPGRLPEDWIAAVLDASGTVAARTHEEARFIGGKGAPDLVRRMGEVTEDALSTTTLEGIPVITVFSRAPASGYVVAIGIPERELVRNLVFSLARLFLAGFSALLLALGFALVLHWRFLRRNET